MGGRPTATTRPTGRSLHGRARSTSRGASHGRPTATASRTTATALPACGASRRARRLRSTVPDGDRTSPTTGCSRGVTTVSPTGSPTARRSGSASSMSTPATSCGGRPVWSPRTRPRGSTTAVCCSSASPTGAPAGRSSRSTSTMAPRQCCSPKPTPSAASLTVAHRRSPRTGPRSRSTAGRTSTQSMSRLATGHSSLKGRSRTRGSRARFRSGSTTRRSCSPRTGAIPVTDSCTPSCSTVMSCRSSSPSGRTSTRDRRLTTTASCTSTPTASDRPNSEWPR